MAWSYILCATRTGQKLATLTPISAGSWVRRLAYKGSGSTDFLLSENASLGGDFLGPRRTLVICWDGEPWYAGVVWKRNYKAATGVVTISHSDIWSIWERRLAGPQFQASTIEGRRVIQTRVTYTTSLRTHFKRAVQLGMMGPELGLPEYELPIVLEDDIPGNHVARYWTYDFRTVAEALSDIMDRTINTVVDFKPEWSETNALQWRMRLVAQGTDSEMFISVDTPESELTDVDVSEDFEEHATEVHVTGEGSETGTLHRRRWDNSPAGNRVALHHHEAMSEIKDVEELSERAEGEYWARRQVPQQIECTAQIGRELSPNRFWLGRTVTLRVHKGDSILAPGEYKRQVIGITSAGYDAVKLELMPIPSTEM